MIPQPASQPFLKSLPPHIHFDGEVCPTCEQEIPPERLKEISGKIAAKQREQVQAITLRFQEQLATEKAEVEAKAKADLELERKNSAAEAERIRQELQTSLQQQLADADAARVAAEQVSAKQQAELARQLKDNQAALAAAKAEAQKREAEIRTEAEQAAQEKVAERLAAIERDRVQAETALKDRIKEVEGIRLAAEQKGANLQMQLDELRTAKDAEVAKVKQDAADAAMRIQQEATEAAAAQVRDLLAAKDQAIADAQAKSAEAESNLGKLSEQYETALSERLGSQREILEKAKDEAVNAERAKAFEDTQKLQNKVSELQRALDNKTAEELGEGAEVNLYEALRKEFPDDRIERVVKGAPGADIHHVVMHRGRECGTIIYDSKNHKVFRTEHAEKLAQDQLAARAEHAILSLHKFPKGTGQLHMHDGILLANPARVVAVATLIRRHMVQTHTLRLSNAQREEKTTQLYAFITSERCAQLLDRIEKQADDLLELQAKEVRWHKNNWEKQGEAYRAIQRAKADLENDIHGIIGTVTEEAAELEDSEL